MGAAISDLLMVAETEAREAAERLRVGDSWWRYGSRDGAIRYWETAGDCYREAQAYQERAEELAAAPPERRHARWLRLVERVRRHHERAERAWRRSA